jgi:hypothetical protein
MVDCHLQLVAHIYLHSTRFIATAQTDSVVATEAFRQPPMATHGARDLGRVGVRKTQLSQEHPKPYWRTVRAGASGSDNIWEARAPNGAAVLIVRQHDPGIAMPSGVDDR